MQGCVKVFDENRKSDFHNSVFIIIFQLQSNHYLFLFYQPTYLNAKQIYLAILIG